MKPILAPSLLSADFLNLESEIRTLEKCKTSWLHLDIMDGHFVPNLTFGPMIVSQLKSKTKMKLDCHLMITSPEKWIESFADAGAHCITVHAEASNHLDRLIHQIKDTGCLAGVSINPSTSLKDIEEVLDIVDLVLIMSVNPGFGGQKFINRTYKKIEKLKDQQKNRKFVIQVDGGVNTDNIKNLQKSGAEIFVAGSAVFKGNVSKNITELNRIINK